MGILCTGLIRRFPDLPRLSARTPAVALPHGAAGRRSMDEQPRPCASSWQIAGVWISAAALLIAAARLLFKVRAGCPAPARRRGAGDSRRLGQQDWAGRGMQLTVHIKEVAVFDRSMKCRTLVVHARNVEEIPDVVKTAAAKLAGTSKTST